MQKHDAIDPFARPAKPRSIHVLLAEDDVEYLARQAAQAGLTRSGYIRAVLRRAGALRPLSGPMEPENT